MARKQVERSPEAIADRRRRIEELSRLGYSVKEICAEVGVGHFTVIAVRKASGLSAYVRNEFTDTEIERAVSLLEGGCSYAEVARTLGRHHQVVSRKFPGYAWTVEQRTEYTNMLREFGQIDGSKFVQEGMWRDKKQAKAERLKREADEQTAEEFASGIDDFTQEPVEPDLEAELRELNRARTTGADRIVSYCDACADNGHSPVLGVYRMHEEAEEQSEQHRVFTAQQGHFEHDPYEYDLFEQPLHAKPEHILPLLRKHFCWSSIADGTPGLGG